MMRDEITMWKLSQEYPRLINHVKQFGDVVPSRIGETKDIPAFRLKLMEPQYCITGRKGFSRKFMTEEAVQLLAGVHDNDRLRNITPLAADLITEATAYGPRTWEQLEAVAYELETSPTSRRAAVYIGRDTDLVRIGEKTAGEMPCTCIWQFRVVDDKIDMYVYMRSWDLVFGLGYDVPSFVGVQMAMAQHLGCEIGTYVHTAGSAHVYERHYNLEVWPEDNGKLDLDFVIQDAIWKTRDRARKMLKEVTSE